MKLFFIKISFLVTVVFISIYCLLYYLPDGYKDVYYKRFSTPRATSLIIGTSRAAQGIFPVILEKELIKENYSLPIFNYSFTLHHSPFGEPYNNSIKLKLKHTDNKLN